MPISTLWAKSMPSIFSRKPCTKCCRACSPSVTMSTPASSCSLTASMVASRLARARSAPEDFQGAHNVLCSASHSGFGSEPAIVVGNSILGLRVGSDGADYLPCLAHDVHMFVMPGLDPGIHAFAVAKQDVDGRHRRAEATPSFGRLWPRP